MRALVVEDEFTNRVILHKFLARYADVRMCTNGREAVETFVSSLAEGNPLSLICMDVMMPEMDGPAALKQIRTIEQEKGIPREQGVKVLMTTGLEESDKFLDDIRELYDGILSKPVRLNTLLDAMAAINLSV